MSDLIAVNCVKLCVGSRDDIVIYSQQSRFKWLQKHVNVIVVILHDVISIRIDVDKMFLWMIFS